MNLRTTVEQTYASDEYLDVDIYVFDLETRGEYRARVLFGLNSNDGGAAVLPSDFEYSPNANSGFDPIENIPDEVRAAFEAAYPQAVQEIVTMLAQLNLRPIKPLIPTP